MPFLKFGRGISKKPPRLQMPLWLSPGYKAKRESAWTLNEDAARKK
jgi:hypothetical protein